MSKNLPYFELIEDYLENTLSPEDRYAFIEELTQNELLQNEVKKHQIAYSIIELGIEQSLRAKLDELSRKDEPEKSNTYNYKALIVVAAAIIVLLLVLLILRQ